MIRVSLVHVLIIVCLAWSLPGICLGCVWLVTWDFSAWWSCLGKLPGSRRSKSDAWPSPQPAWARWPHLQFTIPRNMGKALSPPPPLTFPLPTAHNLLSLFGIVLERRGEGIAWEIDYWLWFFFPPTIFLVPSQIWWNREGETAIFTLSCVPRFAAPFSVNLFLWLEHASMNASSASFHLASFFYLIGSYNLPDLKKPLTRVII